MTVTGCVRILLCLREAWVNMVIIVSLSVAKSLGAIGQHDGRGNEAAKSVRCASDGIYGLTTGIRPNGDDNLPNTPSKGSAL